MKKSAEAMRALRQANLAPERPDAASLRLLDSSIKRNTAVIKKLKQITEEQRDGLLDDIRSLNMSKFVSEAVSAICDTKLKSSDVDAAVQVCSLLHQRYKDFAPNLIQSLMKIFIPGKGAEDLDSDRSTRAMKKRSTLRLLMELYFCGVFEDAGHFVAIMKDLTATESLKDRETTQTNLSLLVSFARQGRVFLGLPLVTGQDGDEEIYKELSVTPDQKRLMRRMIQTFFDSVVDILQAEHSALRQLEIENARMLNARGELTEETGAAYEKLRKSFETLFRNVSSFAEAVDTQPPVMPEDGHTTRVTSGDDGTSATTGKEAAVHEPIWDDEDTKSFYESLPDLRAFVPAVLLGEAEHRTGDHSAPQPMAKGSDLPDARDEMEQALALSEARDGPAESELAGGESAPSADELSPSSLDKVKHKDEKDRLKEMDKKEADKKSDKDTEKEKVKGAEGASLESLLQRLPGCVSRDLIDQLTVDFCYLNSKSNRKKLIRTLFNVPRTSLELLPYYSRMVATLSTCMKDVGPLIVQWLEEEFYFLVNKKDQMNIETKIRNIRFIGELAKFRVAPPGLIFTCLKSCLDDFSHHNIDVACNLLETCGRFLYRSPETSLRMGNMLEIIMRLKNVKNLDARHSTMVENAYYQCKPPERSARVSKVRPPLHQYIRKLLFSDLDKSSIERVLRQLRKLPWNDCQAYLLKCFMKVHRGKYSHVHLIASLTAGLSRYHDGFAVAVVDEVLEEIRVGLEVNNFGMQQLRIAYMRFLGELYSYRLVDSPVIFDTLYLIMLFGYGTPEQDTLDPPEDCFRLRLIITLLETCGQFFDRGSSKRRLDRFLLSFQRYVLSKGVIPLDIEFDLQDLFAELRPKMARFTTFEEANQALLDLEEKEQSMAVEVTGSNKRDQLVVPDLSNGLTNAASEEQGVENGVEDNGAGVADEVDSESETESGSMELDGQEEDEEMEDKYGDQEEDADEDDDDDNGLETVGYDDDEHVTVKQKKVIETDPAEEAEFEREFRALMQESLDSRKLEMRARPTLNMMIPMNLFEGNKDHNRIADVESADEATDDGGEGNNVSFRVLVKKGNKQHTKHLHIPRDCSLVLSTKQKEAAEFEEKQDIKRLVLEYNEREEEDRAAAAPQPMNWSLPSASSAVGRGSGIRPGWESSSRLGSRQRRPVAAGYGGRRRWGWLWNSVATADDGFYHPHASNPFQQCSRKREVSCEVSPMCAERLQAASPGRRPEEAGAPCVPRFCSPWEMAYKRIKEGNKEVASSNGADGDGKP